LIFITDNPELYDSILGIYGYMMQNEETINGLSAISRDTCETYITDAKWEEGWKKIATGAINPLKDLMGEEAYNKALAISTTTADVVCLAGAVKNTVKGIRDAKAAKGMPEEVPTEVPKIEEPNLAEIEKQADLEGEFYEDIFESQRADIPEYEDYLSDLAEASSERSGRTPEMGGETSYGKSSRKYKSTADFLTNIENRNGKFYTDKATIDKIGQIEARGEDFSLLNKRIMSSRASTEGGSSIVYKYSDELGTKYLLHEVTDAKGYIIHRDFDAVRILSGQLINKAH
jgi:hypothetical protein